MSELRLADEQRHPVERHDEHCLLAAGAGSGKTRVLVERYLRILADAGWDPRLPARILAVTFTDKAALEMRGRILGRLQEEKAAATGDARDALRALGRELETAPISTIHGFCSRVLREHAVEAGLDPRFSVPAEMEQARLREEVMDGLLAENDADLAQLTARFELKDLEDGLEALRGLRRSLGLALDESAAAALAAAQDAALHALLATALVADQAALARWLDDFTALLPGGVHPQPAGREKLAAARALLATRPLDAPWPELPAALKASLGGLRCKGKDLDEAAGGPLATSFDGFKRAADDATALADAWRISAPGAPEAAEFQALRAAAFRVAARLDQRLRARMRARAWLDFEDLQLETLRLLRENEGVRRRLRELYSHVLVDELQDTNRLQMELLRLLVPEDTPASRCSLFLVGDARQSIYGFRNADVEIFRGERRRMGARNEAHSLRLNHRSHPALLAALNGVFTGDDFAPLDSLEPERAAEGPRVLVQIAPRGPGERKAESRLGAAEALVATLREARDGGLEVGRGDRRRPIDWGDMAILLRSGASARPLLRALAAAEVPYAADAGREYFMRRELRDLEWLVAALDDPYQPFALLSGLRGDLLGMRRADLLALLPPLAERRDPDRPLPDRDRGELLARLERAAAGELGLSDHGRASAARFLSLRARFGGRLHRLPLAELLPALVEATDYDLRAALAPQGLRALRNLRQLAGILGDMESGRRLTLREFVDGMSRFRVHATRQQEAWVPEEGGSLLRVMTIHGAKGLEFPLVALFDLDRELRPGQKNGDLCSLHEALADGPAALLGLRLKDPGRPKDDGREDAARRWIVRERKRREIAENLRLLYVAMTRAEDHLILAGGVDAELAANWPEAFLSQPAKPERDFLELIREALAGSDDLRGRVRLALAGEGDTLPGPRLGAVTPGVAPGAGSGDAPGANWSTLAAALPAGESPLELPVTGLTLLGSCPLRWLFERRLRLGRLFRPESEPWVPQQRERLESEGVGGVALGSALHALLERWDFRRPFAEAWSAACPPGLPATLREEARALLAEFFAGKQPWLERLAQAEELRREEPFVHAMEGVLLTGQTDLVFRWRDQSVLIDWKSDRVQGRERLLRRLGHHSFQVLLYALALEAAGRPVDQALVVFLRAGEDGGFRQVKLEPFDLEWARNRARNLATLALDLTRLEADGPDGVPLDRVPRAQDPPCQDCPFRDGPCPRSYRQASHGLRDLPAPGGSR